MFDSVGSEEARPKRTRLEDFPWGQASVILGGGILALYLVQVILGGTGLRGVYLAGATHPEVLPELALWTLASSTLLHMSWWHALGNAVFIAIIGSRVESRVGPWRMLVVFFCGGLTGSALSVILAPEAVGAGASGGGWGLMLAEMALWAAPSLRRGGPATIRGRDVLWLLGLNLAISFMPGIAFIAHIAGGLGGAVALVLTHRGERGSWRTAGLGLAALHLGCLAYAMALGRPWEPPPALDASEARLVLDGLATAPVPPHLEVTLDEELLTGLGTLWSDLIFLSYAAGIAPPEGSDSLDAWLTEWGGRHIVATRCGPRCTTRRGEGEGTKLIGVNRRYGEAEVVTFIAVHDEAPDSYWEWAKQYTGDTRLSPDGVDFVLGVAVLIEDEGDLTGALATRRDLVAEHPDDASALNSLAWDYATSPRDALRDGEAAVTLASKACGLEPDNAAYQDTLAAALAETGAFERAVAAQERAVEMAPDLEELAAHLETLRRGEPIRE